MTRAELIFVQKR